MGSLLGELGSNKLSVLVVSRGLPSKTYPLNGIFELDQAIALKNYGHKVQMLVLDFRSFRRIRRFGYFMSKTQGIDILNISFPLGNIDFPFLSFLARILVKLGNFIFSLNKPDVIHAHFYSIGSIALVLKSYYKVPFVVTEHSSLMNADYLSVSNYKVAKKCYLETDELICVSEKLSERILFRFGKKSHVVNNLVDTANFVPTSRDNFSKGFKFISVGALIHRKGFDLLLEAFANARFDSDTILEIYGAGRDLKILERYVTNLGLTHNVIFKGEKNRVEIADSMRNADVFVLASRVETFGVVYIEAMSTGLPVIGTRCGGPESFINSHNGLLVPSEDIDSLSEAMIFMRNNRYKYDSSEIAKFVNEKFSPFAIAESLTKIYQDCIKTKY